MKKYSFEAINYIIADAMLPVLCILVVILSEELEVIKVGSLRVVCNVFMVLAIASLHNRVSNRLFKIECSIEIQNDCFKITKEGKETIAFYEDVDEIRLSIVNNLFGVFVGGKFIELIVKSTLGKTKVISLRFFKNEDLQNHSMVKAFNNIRTILPNYIFLSENDGSILLLKNTNRQ